MNTPRQMKGGVLAAAAALVIIAIAFFSLGRVTSQAFNAPAAIPTATRIVPTATPNLVLRSPHVLGALMDIPQTGAPFYSPSTLSFTASARSS